MQEQTLSVLLVEDDPAHAEITRRGLESNALPARLEHVEDGQAALDYLFRQGRFSDPESSPRPNLILLDLRLPKVEGLEVLRRIKADDQLRRIPVVVLTTSAADPDVHGAYSNQASSYLVKPADYEAFARLFDSLGHYWLAWNRYPG
ncbi:chemotaxis protein CheY [Marichromatium purpuratum 984]|uniref:Chemotaxis protein CheY n=1 Tax=Marichromatium purpuratum 984 TaxID=765910 RepID=W0E0Z2_MARPU|nr:response regulator [Marichromatium purpuratum]AHF03163.1 chemotaxis protein CheY [Marichromatium purpuratum 984]